MNNLIYGAVRNSLDGSVGPADLEQVDPAGSAQAEVDTKVILGEKAAAPLNLRDLRFSPWRANGAIVKKISEPSARK